MSQTAFAQPLRSVAETLWRRPFARFLVVGVVNTLFGYGVFCLALWATQQPTLAVVISTVLGVLFNFRSTGVVVFGSRDPRLLLRFVFVYAFLMVCNILLLRLLALFGLPAALGQALLVLPLAVLSYLLNREFVFLKAVVAGSAR
ncbi:MAG TPA: GtrA family protein [Methylocystis sp.]|nr:GtrA family protein [Methylocystis sp.]